ncbi:hypothetical protein ASPCADRAFT_1743 [Aspergillus carbonarius ITEM 5010]|uniref:Protein kinase domain-containing protein n=1 Tax=Aspergillus carbonarius (strain ITEM 5010) TaxID=602072 RepID=A0A1R3S069_ASPC5|nr:hypothetical protein ASPCADRAFT_1743 [Aspergillus carbonarius ITEM 5010]
MEDKEFFNNHFINRTISFASPDSQWTLIKKLREFNDQRDPEMFLSSPHKPGGAYGTFLCSNPANPTEQNIMRIIMQVPYAGSEIAIHAERARQARDRLPTPGQEMLNAYSTLTKLGSDFTPRLVNVKWAEQTDRDIVPGGSIVYLLLEKLPGRQLGLWFWDLNREERDRVRGAFKVAWT